MSNPPDHGAQVAPRLLKALRGERQDRPPIWLMRQAGRHLPEYLELRAANKSFMDFCYAPAAAAEATLQPLRRYPVDAAILFSDILVIPDAIGCPVWFETGEGPRLEPVATAEDIAKLDLTKLLTRLEPVYETVGRVRGALEPDRTMLGFAGAPWTLATYMIQGRGGDREHARRFAWQHPDLLAGLLDILSEAVALHLDAQLRAGAHAVQIFESWAEDLPEQFFNDYVIAPTAKAIARLRQMQPDATVIGFPRGASHRVGAYVAATGVNAAGIGIGGDLAAARAAVGPGICLQGNLDPICLAAGGPGLDAEIDRILAAAETGPHVFNLGHGVVPWTPPAHVLHLTRRVRGL
jgi:uroporphyrinogen decarboxylase